LNVSQSIRSALGIILISNLTVFPGSTVVVIESIDIVASFALYATLLDVDPSSTNLTVKSPNFFVLAASATLTLGVNTAKLLQAAALATAFTVVAVLNVQSEVLASNTALALQAASSANHSIVVAAFPLNTHVEVTLFILLIVVSTAILNLLTSRVLSSELVISPTNNTFHLCYL
jgi:hypothetical protein